MRALYFTRRKEGTSATNDINAPLETRHETATLIGLSLTFWRTGGLQAVPDILIQKLEYISAIDPSVECVWRMVFLRNRPFDSDPNHLEPVQAVEAGGVGMARVLHSEGKHHD